MKEWLLSPTGTAIADIAGITGITGLAGFTGLIQLVRWLRGRKVSTKIVIEDGRVRIETADGDYTVVTQPVARLVDDPTVRQQLERFTDPLRSEGLDSIRFDSASGSGEAIKADEVEIFAATAGSDPTSQSRFRATYQIKRLYFERGKK